MSDAASEAPIIARSHRWLVLGCLALILLGPLVAVDWTVLGPIWRGEPFPATWSWQALLAVHSLFVLAAIVLLRDILPPLWVELHLHGVRYVSRNGWWPLAWRDVTTIELKGQLLILRAHGRIVRINTFNYTRPEAVLRFVMQAAPQAMVRTAA